MRAQLLFGCCACLAYESLAYTTMLSSVAIPARSSTERSSTRTASPVKSRRPASSAQASRKTNQSKKPFCGTLESSQRQQQLILSAQSASDVAKALLQHPHKANHVNVCTALHRVAKLSNSSSSKLDDATLSKLLAATVVVFKGGRFTARHLSNTLWALAKLGDPSPRLLDDVAATFSRKLISAAPCEISMALWGLVTAGRVEEAVLAPIARSLQPRLHEFAVRDLAGISWSLATADFYDLQLMTAIAAAVTAHATGASSSNSSSSSSSGSSRPIASQDVSMLAWSFGHICNKHWTLGQCAVELMQQ
eukprot:19053-Heterococcus_DN1.PRE.1